MTHVPMEFVVWYTRPFSIHVLQQRGMICEVIRGVFDIES